MAKETFETVFPRLVVTAEVAAMLGTTVEAIKQMDLHTFACLVYDKGYQVDVKCKEAESEGAAQLLICAGNHPQAPVSV